MKFLDGNGLSRLWSKMKSSIDSHLSVEVKDYVVAQGIDSKGWEWRKWNSGKMEAYRTKTDSSVGFDNSMGSYIYYTKGTSSFALPNPDDGSGGFIEPPMITCNCHKDYLVLATPVQVNANNFHMNWTRFASTSTPGLDNIHISFHAEGKWK